MIPRAALLLLPCLVLAAAPRKVKAPGLVRSATEAKAIAETVLQRGVGINHNDELDLPDEKLAAL